jgi:Alpha/beta hydrolase domain
VLEQLETHKVESFADGRYEWVVATASYAVDPGDLGTARIADIELVPTDPDGKVRFHGDVVMLRPIEGGNGRALLSVPNRGVAHLPFTVGALPGGTAAPLSAGDGYLLSQGWTIAFPGWQWDVPAGLVGFSAPVLEVEPGWLRADFRIDAPIDERSLGEVFPMGPGLPAIAFAVYPTADATDRDATMRVRTAQLGPSQIVPRAEWSFTSPTTIQLHGGFQPSRWYEIVYRSRHAPVVGAGLLAIRDFGSHLRRGHDAVFAHGISQTGRFLREFLYEGLNVGEDGQHVFDGLFIDIASARRGEFNRRYAQPGLLAPMMPEYGPPYDSASLLQRQRSRGGVPKIFLKNSAAEYWRGDGALVHQDALTGADLPEDPDVRVYLVSGTDHIGAAPMIKSAMPLTNPPHNLDPTPIHRGLLVQLQEWVLDGVEPEPSSVPRVSDGTAVTRRTVLDAFDPDTIPDIDVLPYTPEIDPASSTWPIELGAPRVALVSAVDGAGNERAGIRLPAVETGIAAYTGWNPRRPVDGLPDVLFDLVGSRLPSRTGDTPIADDLRRAAEALVERRFLLPSDVDLVIRQSLAELEAT